MDTRQNESADKSFKSRSHSVGEIVTDSIDSTELETAKTVRDKHAGRTTSDKKIHFLVGTRRTF